MGNTALNRRLDYLSKHTWNRFGRFDDDDVEYQDDVERGDCYSPQPLHSHRLSTEVLR